MAKYLTRQRKRLLTYLSEHTDEQMTARQIADALTADNISISAVYRNLSALEEEGLLKRSVREGTRRGLLSVYRRREMQGQPASILSGMRKKYPLGEADTTQLIQSTLETQVFKSKRPKRSSTAFVRIAENKRAENRAW